MTSSSNNQAPLPSAPPALIVTAESVTVAQQSPSPVMATAQIMNQQQNNDIQITVAASVPATTGAGQTTQNNTHEPPVQKFILTAKSGKNGSHEGQAAHGGHGRYNNGPRGIGHRGKHGQNGMNAQPPLPGGNSGTIDISVSMENICNNGKVDVKGALKGGQDSYPTTNTYFVPVTTDFIVEAKGGAGGDGGFGGIGGNGGHGRSGRVRNSYGYSFHYTLLIFILF